jgi:hypothetical protein
MKWALGVIACVVLLSGIAQGQANPSTTLQPTLQPTPLEAFAALPVTRIVLAKEVGRIDSTEAHVVVTALTLEDTAQPPDRMSGVRIDLSTTNDRDQVYLGEETLGAYKNALDEISAATARGSSLGSAHAQMAPGGVSCTGAQLFWYAYKVPRVHALEAAYCSAPGSSGLTLSAFKQVDFRFPGQNAAQLSVAIAEAIDQLKAR